MSRDYRKLRVFQSANILAKEIYTVTKSFPREEMFGLTSQLRRAALSVPTNIVEGSHRSSLADYIRFLDISMGSLAETGCLIEFAEYLGYIEPSVSVRLLDQQKECIRSLK
ncbi:four helix bundle protein [bacterium]|nr:four helix bundle protein [bacterium]